MASDETAVTDASEHPEADSTEAAATLSAAGGKRRLPRVPSESASASASHSAASASHSFSGSGEFVPSVPLVVGGSDMVARQLMLRVQRGEIAAFDAIFVEYHRRLFNFFLKLGCERSLADDLVQETFLRLWRTAPRYHPSGKFTTYLFQIAKNLWLNEREKLARRHAFSLDATTPDTHSERNGGQVSESSAMRDPSGGPAEQAASNELREMARTAIAELDEKHRLVLILSHFEGFKYREIAEILEIPEGTVKTRMMHAEQKLRNKLTKRIEA